MKKLLAPLTLLLLVACQPSELERCVAVNSEPPINNYIIKYNLYIEQRDAITNNSDGYSSEAFNELADDFYNSLNPLELIVNQCFFDMYLYIDEGLTQSEYIKREKQNAESCMLSTANEVKELQLKIEAENTEKAQSVCNAQGIY
jgi:hypothetical protein